MQVRVLAFAIDFLVAADNSATPVEWGTAQEIVQARILQISQDIRLSLAETVLPTSA
jgi:hypothetical protein